MLWCKESQFIQKVSQAKNHPSNIRNLGQFMTYWW